jgi:hypothetical protein
MALGTCHIVRSTQSKVKYASITLSLDPCYSHLHSILPSMRLDPCKYAYTEGRGERCTIKHPCCAALIINPLHLSISALRFSFSASPCCTLVDRTTSNLQYDAMPQPASHYSIPLSSYQLRAAATAGPESLGPLARRGIGHTTTLSISALVVD